MMNSLSDVLAGRGQWCVEQADCLPWLESLPADSVDLMMCSPTYELARTYLENGKDLAVARSTDAWVSWLCSVASEMRRVCVGLCVMVVAGQTKNFRWSAGPALLMAELYKSGFNLRNPPIFYRFGIPGSGGPDWFRSDYETCVCFTRGKLPWSDPTACGHKPKYGLGGEMSNRLSSGARVKRFRADEAGSVKGGHARDIVAIANPGNVVQAAYTSDEVAALCTELGDSSEVSRHLVGGGVMGHPLAHKNEAPYPLSLAERFIKSFCTPGGVVCDPFSGSGTTLHGGDRQWAAICRVRSEAIAGRSIN